MDIPFNLYPVTPFQGLPSFFVICPRLAPGVIHIAPLTWCLCYALSGFRISSPRNLENSSPHTPQGCQPPNPPRELSSTCRFFLIFMETSGVRRFSISIATIDETPPAFLIVLYNSFFSFGSPKGTSRREKVVLKGPLAV